MLIAGDQACSAGKREVSVGPLEQHKDAVAKSDQKINVNDQPCDPCRETRPVCLKGPFNFRNGGKPSYRCHVALVEIMELSSRLIREVLLDHHGDVVAHLQCGLRNAGYLVPVLLNVREI